MSFNSFLRCCFVAAAFGATSCSDDAPATSPRTSETVAEQPDSPPIGEPTQDPVTAMQLLKERRKDKEPIFLCPSEAIAELRGQLEAAGIPFKLPTNNHYQYYLNRLIPQVRRHGSVWLVFDHREAELVETLNEYFLKFEKVAFEQRAGNLTLIRVVNQLEGTEAEEVRLGLTPVARGSGMVTGIKFTPDGSIMLVSSKGGSLHWRSMADGEGGELLKLPQLRNGPAGVFTGGESGLIGLAVHPEFPKQPRIFLQYNFKHADGSRAAILSEWQADVSGLPRQLTLGSERKLLELEQTRDNHNAGDLEFGPDGFLYVAIGDGEEGKWTIGRSPAHTMRGKILRLDVDSRTDDKQYGIPADNPFVGHETIPPETWAWGFRNPWRISFTPDGRLVAGEIGEDVNEEVTMVRRGRHHGWPYVEGTNQRNPWKLGDEKPEPPLFAYPRDYGMSVIGGYLYRGESIPWLQGKYVFCDFLSGRMWMLELPEKGQATRTLALDEVRQIGRWPMLLTTFGEAPDGTLYLGGHTGEVFRLDPADGSEVATDEPAKLDFAIVQSVFGTEFETPEYPASSDAVVTLGRELYADAALSNGTESCASCHALDNHGQDGERTSPGMRRNAPTTFNAHRQFAQFWDYRAETVDDLGEHGLQADAELTRVLRGDARYRDSFAAAFPGDADARTAANARRAIGAFVRSLVTTSRWDKFLDGDESALTDLEKTGLAEFVAVGCVTCHQYRALGGGMPQKLGLVKPWTGEDRGRVEVSGVDSDAWFFKVSPLLNVAETAPYYHDGSIATLEEAIRNMATIQLNRELSDRQVEAMVAFFRALTGETPRILR